MIAIAVTLWGFYLTEAKEPPISFTGIGQYEVPQGWEYYWDISVPQAEDPEIQFVPLPWPLDLEGIKEL